MSQILLEYIFCPGCHGHRFKTLETVFLSPVRVQTKYLRCLDCHLAYASPRPTPATEKSFYESEYFDKADLEEWAENRQAVFSQALKELGQSNLRGKLFDVGCGGGFFMAEAVKQGWACEGTDLSHKGVQYAKDHFGLKVHRVDLKEAAIAKDAFQVVTFWNVLDQVLDPSEQIKKAWGILKPGGMIGLRVSNFIFHRFAHQVFNLLRAAKVLPMDAPEPTVFHLVMFDPRSVRRFFENHGFVDIKIMTSCLDSKTPSLTRIFGKRGGSFLAALSYHSLKFLERVTFGHIILGPSLLVFARKGLHGKN